MAFYKRIIKIDASGISTLHEPKKKKRKKVDRWLRPADRMVRRQLKALDVFGTELRERSEKSARKKKNGGMRDRNKNMRHAGRKALKTLKLFRV
jgi:hypothetical protein